MQTRREFLERVAAMGAAAASACAPLRAAALVISAERLPICRYAG
jgi:hypothetical protein